MKLWGGRFEKATDHMVDDFHSSISFDKRLAKQDIAGSVAHAIMLGEQGIIAQSDADEIVRGLNALLDEYEKGELVFEEEAEDIHMNIEKLLTEKIGDAGKRLHTGRSRNDQVALDARMFFKDCAKQTKGLLLSLMRTVLAVAKEHIDTVMPGYTHLQKAQPVTLAHHMLCWFQMLRRDATRLDDCLSRGDEMPLGAGALATSTYPIDRERVRELLGFARITENSMDSVSDRDYMLEYMSCASISMMHLSRCCEELILWSSAEFGFVEMDDGFSTGSSIMPQKKNPDVAELIRGKTGRVYGDLMALLTVMKGLPQAYNKDMQEDKEAFFDSHDTWSKCLLVFDGMLKTVRFKKDVLRSAASGGFTNATDAADYLVKKGMPFREAHAVIGKLVLDCIKKGVSLDEIPLDALKDYSPLFGADVYQAIDVSACVAQRRADGGPAPEAVQKAIESAQSFLASEGAK
ncbi:MAG: argininosuccinate lyase [Christensenellales bacterium]|jgi:argininosuccinate lyase